MVYVRIPFVNGSPVSAARAVSRSPRTACRVRSLGRRVGSRWRMPGRTGRRCGGRWSWRGVYAVCLVGRNGRRTPRFARPLPGCEGTVQRPSPHTAQIRRSRWPRVSTIDAMSFRHAVPLQRGQGVSGISASRRSRRRLQPLGLGHEQRRRLPQSRHLSRLRLVPPVTPRPALPRAHRLLALERDLPTDRAE
jgi:hypothetical protein